MPAELTRGVGSVALDCGHVLLVNGDVEQGSQLRCPVCQPRRGDPGAPLTRVWQPYELVEREAACTGLQACYGAPF